MDTRREPPAIRAGSGAQADWALQGGGEMGAVFRALDWSTTPLGPPEGWPRALRTVVSILLNTRYPMFIAWGPDLAFLYNDGYRPIMGEKHPGWAAQPFARVWAEIWGDIAPLVHAALEGNPTWSEDLLLFMERRGFPEEVYFTFSYSPIRDDRGEVGGMLCACTETTAQVQGQRRIDTLRRLGDAAVEARNVSVARELCMRALEGNREDVPFALLYRLDEGTARLAGSVHVPAGSPLAPSTIAVDDPAAPWPLADLDAAAGRIVADLPARFGDDLPSSAWTRARPTEAIVLPVSERGGRETGGFLVVGLNPCCELDARYREFLGQVAGSVATAVATARAYAEERERAEALAELDRAKTAFFSNVSHEFRTPLTLALGPLEDALADTSDALSDGHRVRLELAHRNSLRLLRLVNTMLDFSRIEAGRIEASYEPTDLGALTTDLASMFRSAMDRAGLRFTIEAAPISQWVYVDRQMWEKIVLNLLSNAFKFTLAGEVRVAVRERDGEAELEVRDTGVGISAADLPKVFERFQRAEGVRARSQEGTGIGLALVEQLVRLHGGSVTVESETGRGSVFRVRIPTGTAHLPPGRIGAERTLASTTLGALPYVEEALRWLPNGAALAGTEEVVPRPGPSSIAQGAAEARVLFADDNADMREYVRRILEPHWRVDTASDGEQALAMVRADPPDLLLADVMMPGLDGFRLLESIRGDPEIRTLPVILLSARAGEESRVEGMAAGADDYLVKPFSARELVARIWAHLELASVREGARIQEREARRAAEDALEIREQFVATVSHELRTPLNAIIGYLDLLLEGIGGELSAAQRLHLSRGRAGAIHLREIIEGILTFSRLEAGEETPDWADVSLATMVTEVADLMEPLVLEKGLEFEVRVPPGGAVARTDAGKVRQIVINLLSNAVKYTERGTVRVEVMSAGDSLAVTVSDTGLGIAPEDRERIFEPFRRLPGTRHHRGTGLGLTVSQSLAQLLGGRLTLESRPGEGSAFTLHLPTPGSEPAPVGNGADRRARTPSP